MDYPFRRNVYGLFIPYTGGDLHKVKSFYLNYQYVSSKNIEIYAPRNKKLRVQSSQTAPVYDKELCFTLLSSFLDFGFLKMGLFKLTSHIIGIDNKFLRRI